MQAERTPADNPQASLPIGRKIGSWTYVLAVAVTATTLSIRLACAPWFGDRTALVLFVLPIMLSAYVGGLGPGLLATVAAGLLTSYFLVPPYLSFAMERPVDMVQWLILILIGVVISLLTESLHRSRLRDPDTVAIGQHFTVELAVCAKDNTVKPDTVRVDAHMPEHRHGMNYKTKVHSVDGPESNRSGRYRAEGLMFHMPGRWEYIFEVRAGTNTERLTTSVVLK